MRFYKNIIYDTIVVIFTTVIVIFCTRLFLLCTANAATLKPPVQVRNYSILIDLEEKRLYLLNNGKLYKKYNCAVGKSETPSPIGSYKITQKSNWGEGFGGYWLGINCPWGNFGIHGTLRPESIGTAASHGCFRMFNTDIEELYKIVPIGTPVCVTGGLYGAFGNRIRTISPYMYGLDVQVVQKRLVQLGYYKGYCNGKYDTPDLKTAIHKFQKANGLTVSDQISKKMLEKLGFILMD